MPNLLRSTLPPIAAHLIACVFYALAAFLLYQGTNTMLRVHAAKEWVEVPARTVRAEMNVQRKLKSHVAPSQRLVGTYAYMWEGQEYRSGTIDFSTGSNNFSQPRQERQLAALQAGTFMVHVNPEDPSQSVLDPTLPAPLMAFYSVLIVFPCFLGVAWFWHMPTMFVRRGDKAPVLEAVGRWGTVLTLLYLPSVSMVFFAPALEMAQWGIFVALFAVVFGVRALVRYPGRKSAANSNRGRAR